MKLQTAIRRHGFTLTEMLIVVIIIAALAVLSFLGFSRIRAAGDRATAMSVMRQIQVANASYASDHSGIYVPVNSKKADKSIAMEWYRNPEFLIYLTGDEAALEKPDEVVVPTSLLDPVVVRSKKRWWDKLCASYGYNDTGVKYATDDTSPPVSFRTTQITDPARTAFLFTATDYAAKYPSRFNWLKTPVEGKTTDGKIAFRHGGMAIVVYYDGSSGLISPEDLRRIDRDGGKEHPFWKANF